MGNAEKPVHIHGALMLVWMAGLIAHYRTTPTGVTVYRDESSGVPA